MFAILPSFSIHRLQVEVETAEFAQAANNASKIIKSYSVQVMFYHYDDHY